VFKPVTHIHTCFMMLLILDPPPIATYHRSDNFTNCHDRYESLRNFVKPIHSLMILLVLEPTLGFIDDFFNSLGMKTMRAYAMAQHICRPSIGGRKYSWQMGIQICSIRSLIL